MLLGMCGVIVGECVGARITFNVLCTVCWRFEGENERK
jgi:hypothetical protein